MQKIIKSIIVFLFLFSVAKARSHTSYDHNKVVLYADVSTFGIWSSTLVNVEVLLASSYSGNLRLYGKAATGSVSFIPFLSSNQSVEEIKTKVGALTLLTGQGNHHFDASGGIFKGRTSILPFLDLGYRYQRPEGGFVFRGKAGALGIGIGIGCSF
jgi:hypothetical protein